jgi:hypothetical protein
MDLPRLTVGVVYGHGAFHAAQRVGSDSNGHNYQTAVPVGVPLTVWLHSRYFTMADAQGAPIPSTGGLATFQATPGVDRNYVVNITAAYPNPLP